MTETTEVQRRKAPKPPIEAQVRLLDWAPKGSVWAEVDGRRVVIDRGIPEEEVSTLISRGRGPRNGVVTEVLEPSPQRVPPQCPHYREGCGGCQVQHLSYSGQVLYKRAMVDREMEAAGVPARVDTVHTMIDPWRYRRTAAIAIGWEAGFRPRGRRGIVEIHDCPISHPSIGRLTNALNTRLRAGNLPNYHGKVWLDCTVVGSEREPSVQVVVQGMQGLTLETHPELPEVAEQIASIAEVCSVAYRHRSGSVHPLIGDLMSTIEVAGRPYWLPAGSFFQTNLRMLPRLMERMARSLERREIRHGADIYGGAGTFALALAHLAGTMTLVELDPFAVAAARRTVADWGLSNVECVSRHAERALPELPHMELLIVDPPRSGLGQVVTDAIAANDVSLVLYVSCAPSSLARDLAALIQRGYRVTSLEAFDFYPQTYHVESFAVLER